jgi:hypothetical protein
MKLETLERLVIDQHLGEFSSDVSELLEEYIRQQPQWAETAAALRATIEVARRAIQGESERDPGAPPAFSKTVRPLSVYRPVRPRSWYRAATVAAAVIGAFWLGERLASKPAATPHTAMVSSAAAATGAKNDFWSLGRIQQATGRHLTDRKQHIEWTGPWNPSWTGEQS